MTWLEVAEGEHGWTALPRLALWLCVPALIAGAAGVTTLICRAVVSPTSSVAPAIASAVALVAVFFGMMGMVLTPVAALLILVLSLLRRWRKRVLAVLWLVVIIAIGVILPAVDAAISDWLVLGRVHQGQGPRADAGSVEEASRRTSGRS